MILRKLIPLFLACAAISLPAWAEVIPYMLIPEKSHLKFVAMQNDAPVTGQFKDFTTAIRFDYDRPENGSITAEVKTGSLATDYEEVEKNLRLPEWLSTEAFPVATFRTTKISKMPMSYNYYADGELTLRGRTVPVSINFQIKDYGDMAIAEGFATLKRNDFGVGQGEWAKTDAVKNEVRVEFRIAAKKK